ncbi:hypothetical protein [uncultured Desulfosarcina sp.]|uniref:hypothetical protein n=1 Tax=uncultured Desulfosarcina sp. TaxID=218289 RepID=UPI0029C8EAE7|nr:hypothetical protein [uncultured Desulfosarcina sp.]
MIERIHIDPKLEKCLATLRKGSRRACLAVDRVETIIEEVKRGKLPPEETCTFTRNGEGRIKGCRKYDLNAGYRLITLKQGEDLYLLFVGTHDDCTRWIENNREHLPVEMIAERCMTIERTESRKVPSEKPSRLPGREPDEDWIPPLSDRDLRMIFSGLVGGK